MKCLVCNSKMTSLLGNIGERNIYHCNDCMAQFVYPVVPYKIKKYVANDLYNPYYGWLGFNRQARMIRKYINNGKILDYGCGGGQFLSHMGGWKRYGLDTYREARIQARKKGVKTYSNIGRLPKGFDVITMFAVIEHLEKPKEVIKELSEILKAGGLFVVMTGDVTSDKAKRLGLDWHMYISPEHYYFFSAKSIDMMMFELNYDKVGFLCTDGGMYGVPYLDKIPILNRKPLFDHYYGYYMKR